VTSGWEFWIDRGGTFTDCIARSPAGDLRTVKLLSSDTAPVEAVRRILEAEGVIEPGDALPACSVKLGSTVATNALLERRGVPTAIVTHGALGDVFTIGTQERPELFELAIHRPPPVHTRVVPVVGRVDVDGEEVEALDLEDARRALVDAREAGIESVAVVLAHAYAYPEMEEALVALAREVGIPDAIASHRVAREVGLLARGETTAADAYLTPLLQRHVSALAEALPGSRLRFMQSSGGLTEASRFRGPTALLSGPAGGVVAAARVAARAGFEWAIGFDMGGTSTDVSLIVRGQVERAFETIVGGIRVKSPMLKIHTVAAGGGSLCRFDGFRLTVGPESAGADPGPLCYGAPAAAELTVTDANLFLGRLLPDRFPFPLDASRVRGCMESMQARLAEASFERSLDEVAAGFVEIANASMAEAIQQVSVGRGVDPRDCVLVGFGGAGGQHVCAIARALQIRRILLHPLAGLLSAYGIGVAEESWDGQRDAARAPVPEPGADLDARLLAALEALEAEGRAALAAEGVASAEIGIERWLELRYRGTDTPLAICDDGSGTGAFDWAGAFAREHERRFGYARKQRPVEITTVRIRARGPAPGAEARTVVSGPAEVAPEAEVLAWFPGVGRALAPVYRREALRPGAGLEGPAIVLEDAGTVVVDPGFSLRVDEEGVVLLRDESRSVSARSGGRRRPVDVADPVRLEVFGNRFMSIAEQMGAVLRNTSVSTNIKERLDYSCAVFDRDGGLVANAPHIPVHLGAMSETVRAVLAAFPDLTSGDVIVTNDPFSGGSHLPDVTVVTPVFLDPAQGELDPAEGAPAFFVASRGHHADIGGSTPGSMPPASQSLEEEGVVIPLMRLVRDGVLDEEGIRALLEGGRYPARQPADNLADMEAMVAANRAGEALLQGFAAGEGPALVAATMGQLQAASAAKVAREIGRLPDGTHRFEDQLDDGTPIRVRIDIDGERMRVDFAGTGGAVPGNLNAPRAIVQAAVIYVLRSLVAERIPLNGGCLDPVEVLVPAGSILDPPSGRAVVGGNVETSQRVVDVLLGALQLAAASQGTMNNVTFGDEHFGYYETIAGGSGAGPTWNGTSGVHTHMTNTRITDLEVLESRYPVRLLEFSLRRGSGGVGRHRGGEGVVRRYLFRAPVSATLLTERRITRPYGLAGGGPGQAGRNAVERASGELQELPGKCSISLGAGDVLCVETPGGGGFGALSSDSSPPKVRPGA
jgi:5-oxoprolinase (ATP-hydrolysing)